jgi:pyruvate/2-oxoglutarate dehydrogenase complex dihydrolipoamide acyltransferase (E2) component
MAEFLMPSLGADMESGTLLKWYVKPGDAVKRGDIVALVDTSKAEIEVEIFEEGVIDELLIPEGARVPVGTVLATVRPNAAGTSPAVSATVKDEAAAPPPTPAPEPAVAPAPTGAAQPLRAAISEDHRLRVSPLARRAAEQLGVDLSEVSGSGPNGAITKADVERASSPAVAAPITRAAAPALAAPAAPPAVTPTARQAAMREAIGALMARSKREIPHYYLELQIDVSGALEWLHQANLARGQRPAPTFGAAAQRRRAGGCRDAGDERLLDRRRLSTRCRGSSGRRDLAAGRRPDRAGAARCRPEELGRDHGRRPRPRRASAGWKTAQLGDVGPDDHRHEPRGAPG